MYIQNIRTHVERLCQFNRIICSEEYDNALCYVTEALKCSEKNLFIDEFPAQQQYRGWRVPARMEFWRENKVDSFVTIPNDRPMKTLHVHVPGISHHEIIFVAHLDHPKPSANDNASGVAMLIELINYYVDNPPQFSLRFLFTVEFYGTVAFCDRYEKSLSSVIAGVSLDMVGADQDKCGSTMIVDEVPHHLSTCFDLVLMDCLYNKALSGSYRELSNPVIGFRCDFQYMTCGSDHYVLNDISVSIPSTCLNTYPDRYYHTKRDTPDKISSKTLCLFFRTIIDSVERFSDTSEKGTNYAAQLVQSNLEKVVNSIFRMVTSGGVTEHNLKAWLWHSYIHSEERIESLRSTHNVDNLNSWINILKEYWENVKERHCLITGNRLKMPGWNNPSGYTLNFQGPLCRDRLFELISKGEKGKIESWIKEDKMFFHKIDSFLNYCTKKGSDEIVNLLSLHYIGTTNREAIMGFIEILVNYNLLKIK